ncbi:MAG: RNA methyltransferase, partial [Actinomycetota bacterium]|nr:RNA methyltransferase [Actinomycetota bacterium]
APGPRVALVPGGRKPIWQLDVGERVTFVLGAEREGLPADVLARCDDVAAIPLAPAADSLNVAMAGTIALYEWRRRR